MVASSQTRMEGPEQEEDWIGVVPAANERTDVKLPSKGRSRMACSPVYVRSIVLELREGAVNNRLCDLLSPLVLRCPRLADCQQVKLCAPPGRYQRVSDGAYAPHRAKLG